MNRHKVTGLFVWLTMTATLVWVLWSCLPDEPPKNYKEGFKDEWCDYR